MKSGSKEPTIEIDEKMLAEITQRVAIMLMGKKLSPIDAAMAAQVRSSPCLPSYL